MKNLFVSIALILTIAFNLEAQATKKVFIEKYTSANCGNCPRATEALKDLTAGLDNVIWVSHHGFWIADAMQINEVQPLYNDFTGGAAPRAAFDRVKFDGAAQVAVGTGTWEARLTTQLATPSYTNISITQGVLDNGRIEAQIDVNFDAIPEAGDLRITAFLVESSVTETGSGYDQRNYDNNNPNSPLYGLGDPIVGYEHLNVTRAILTDTYGDAGIIPTQIELGTTYTHSVSAVLDEAYNLNNLSIVALVHYHSQAIENRQVLNANEAKVIDIISDLETPQQLNLLVAPNPFRTQATIELPTAQAVQLHVFDAQGKRCSFKYTQLGQQLQVHSSNHPSGVYFYEITNTEKERIGAGKWSLKRE